MYLIIYAHTYMTHINIMYILHTIYVTKIMAKDAMNLKESIALHERCWMEVRERESDIVVSNFEKEKNILIKTLFRE